MSNSTIERTPGFIIMGIVYSRKRETALRSKTDRTPLDVEITDMKTGGNRRETNQADLPQRYRRKGGSIGTGGTRAV